jgi:tripartite-type tricarboxylate transporter receptor subunit TctC
MSAGFSALRRRLIAALPAAAAVAAVGRGAFAQGAYPDRPIKLIVPFPPGALTDALGRLVAERLRPALGQSFVVENRAGAGTLLGASVVAKGPADGYQLLVATTTTLAISPAMFSSPPAVPADFTGVGMIGSVSLVLVTRPDLGVSTLPELVSLMRRDPGKYSYGSPGNGTMHQLTLEMVKAQEKVSATHVPYQGSMTALSDLMTGRIDFMFLDVVAALPQVQAGKINPVAVSAAHRLPALPNVQTVAEIYPSIDVQAWQSIVAPRNTPDAIVQRLNGELNRQLADPETKKALQAVGVEPNPMSTAALNDLIARDARRFGELVRTLGLKAS